MKTTKLIHLWAALLGVAFTLPLRAQTTAFTYQGSLSDNGVAASGIYDLRFAIYDDPSAGSPQGDSLTNAAIAVSNGVFTVTLDFGAGVFDGGDRWLEIGVVTNGGGAFSTLSPRQCIASAPYAIRAANASNASALSGTISANQLTGIISSNNIGAGSIVSSMLADGAVTTDAMADGAVTLSKLVTAADWLGSTTLLSPEPTISGGFGRIIVALGDDAFLTQDGNDVLLYNAESELINTVTNPVPVNNGITVRAAVGVDRFLVGAPFDNTGASFAGVAYLLGTNGTLLTTFTNPAPANSDQFGETAVSVGGNLVCVGTTWDDAGEVNAGIAYLFGTNGALLATFTNPSPDVLDKFAFAMTGLGADRVLISAPYDDIGATNAGVAYLFSTNGSLLNTFTNPAPVQDDNFGIAVAALGNDRVLISAPYADVGATDSGVVYLYSTNGFLLNTYTNPTPGVSEYFGVSLHTYGGNRVLIGAERDSELADDSGAAYLFDDNGTLLTVFNNPTPDANDYFGASLALVGPELAVIGAEYDDTANTNAGAIYLFGVQDYALGLIAENVAPGAIHTDQLADGSVTAAKIGGVLFAHQIPDLGAGKITSGTLDDARLSSNVALLDAGQTFTGSNTLAGVVIANNANNQFSGDGGGLVNLNASQLASGTIASARLSGTYSSVLAFNNPGNSLVGSFQGDGAGLTNVLGAIVPQSSTGTSVGAVPNSFYLATNADLVTFDLPTEAQIGDLVSISGTGAGGWRVEPGTGQFITDYSPATVWLAQETNRNWESIAASADGNTLVAVVAAGQIHVSEDGGRNWVARDAVRNWQAVACSADGTKMVAVVNPGLIYTSTDAGSNWVARASSKDWTAVECSADGQRMIAAEYDGYIHISVDGGTNWASVGTFRDWRDVASSDDGMKLVAVDRGPLLTGGRIYTSSDGGTNWVARDSNRYWASVASSADGTKLAAGTQSGQIYTSLNSGTNWTLALNLGVANLISIASSADGAKLLACQYGGSLRFSQDGGANWTVRAASRNWRSADCSADGTRFAAVENPGQVYISRTGVEGLSGSDITLQYAGDGEWMVTSPAESSDPVPYTSVMRDGSGGFSAMDIQATTFTGNGSQLTGLNASELASGTVPDGRLSVNIAKLNASQTFTATATFSNATGNFSGSFSGNGSGLTNINSLDAADGSPANALYVDNEGEVGIGAVNPVADLHVNGPIVVEANGVTPTSTSSTNLVNLMIGGGSNPAATDGTRNGISFYEGGGSAAMSLGYDGSGAAGANAIRVYDAVANEPRVSFQQNGRVGIGTTVPETELHVLRGSAGAVAPSTESLATLESDGNAFVHLLTPEANYSGILFGSPVGAFDASIRYNFFGGRELIFRSGGNSTRMVILTNGNVGIGTSTPGYRLELSVDSAGKPNGGSWANSSDARLKQNIQPLAGALDKLVQLRGVTFEWRNPEDHANQTGTQGGFIAQEVAAVFPNWVTEVQAAEHDRALTDNGKIKSLSLPFEFDALVVEAIKEQQQQIHAQDVVIAELNRKAARVDELETRLAALEKIMKQLSVVQNVIQPQN